MTNQVKITPITDQYQTMKKSHPDAIVLMRVGDFYETFGDDAIAVSEICGCTLTRRANGKSASIELAGFPHHALDTYLPKLVRAGKRVGICEQLEDPKKALPKTKNSQTDFQPSSQNQDYMGLFLILTAFIDVINKLSTFEDIRLKTQELVGLATRIGISPKRAFEECYKSGHPSLFESVM